MSKLKETRMPSVAALEERKRLEKISERLQQFPFLYDMKDASYKDTELKNRTIAVMAKELNMETAELDSKIKRIREKTSDQVRSKSVKPWKHYQLFSFLKDHIRYHGPASRYQNQSTPAVQPTTAVLQFATSVPTIRHMTPFSPTLQPITTTTSPLRHITPTIPSLRHITPAPVHIVPAPTMVTLPMLRSTITPITSTAGKNTFYQITIPPAPLTAVEKVIRGEPLQDVPAAEEICVYPDFDAGSPISLDGKNSPFIEDVAIAGPSKEKSTMKSADNTSKAKKRKVSPNNEACDDSLSAIHTVTNSTSELVKRLENQLKRIENKTDRIDPFGIYISTEIQKLPEEVQMECRCAMMGVLKEFVNRGYKKN